MNSQNLLISGVNFTFDINLWKLVLRSMGNSPLRSLKYLRFMKVWEMLFLGQCNRRLVASLAATYFLICGTASTRLGISSLKWQGRFILQRALPLENLVVVNRKLLKGHYDQGHGRTWPQWPACTCIGLHCRFEVL